MHSDSAPFKMMPTAAIAHRERMASFRATSGHQESSSRSAPAAQVSSGAGVTRRKAPLDTLLGSLALPPALRRWSADLALLATVTTVVGLFAISPVTLEHFEISYLTPGGGFFSKFHPSTFVATLAIVLRCLATSRPVLTGWSLVSRDPGAVVLMLAVAIAGGFALGVAHTPVTPLVDTFILPFFMFVLLRDLNPTLVKWLAALVAVVFCVNAVMAMVEFFGHSHLIQLPILEGVSSDPTRVDAVFDWRAEMTQDWRATALLGHPLVNGLIVGALILCLLAPGSNWLPRLVKGPLLLLQGTSMFAFGARLSLVLTAGFGSYLAFQQMRSALRRGARLEPRNIALSLLLLAIICGALLGAYEMGLLDRTIDRFVSDEGSAHTRATMLQMFQPFSWSDIVLGPSQEVVATWQRLNGLEFGIESSWVGLTLNYGLLVTAFIIAGLLAFSRSIVQAAGPGTGAVLLFFFISVSGTASMSGKTTSFAMIVTLALLYLRRDEAWQPLRSVLSVKTV